MGIENIAGMPKKDEWERVMGVGIDYLQLEEEQLVTVAYYMMVHYTEKENIMKLKKACTTKMHK